MKKQWILSLIFVTVVTFGFCQMPAGAVRDSSRSRGGMGRDSAFRNAPAIAKVIGVLRDSASKSSIEFASVALIRMRDSVAIGGSLTDSKGQFSIEELPPGRYILRINSIGYRKMDSKPFMLSPMDPLKDFGTVYVASTQKNLKEVEVAGEKADYVNSLDKKVFNVEKDIVSTGGTAADVLKNVPSVNVDIDGKVSLRGSENLTILIDGKPSGLGGGDKAALLQQLPAGSIEQIEVITNPSARYDAEGMAGIINIKTKKDKRNGINGTITAGVGTRDKYNGGFSLNNRTKNTNLSLSYNYREEARTFTGASDRRNYYTNPETFYETANHGRQYNENQSLKAGFDVNLSKYSTLGLSGGFSTRYEHRNDVTDYSFEDSVRNITDAFYRTSAENNINKNFDAGIDFRHTIPGTKRELSASGTFSSSDSRNHSDYLTDDGFLAYTKQNVDGLFTVGTFQSDYTHPINDKSKFETGIKATIRSNDTDQKAYISEVSDQYIADTNNTDNFVYADQIYAAYAQYAGKIKMFEVQGGLRAEQTNINGDSKTQNKDFTNDYLDLFPSAALKYVLKQKNEFQITYSRRINRPNTRDLNPFTDLSDSLNVRTGNPYLKPEYISSYEFNYFRRLGDHSVSGTLYYRKTNNLIVRYRTIDQTTGISTMTFTNFSSSENTGVEVVIKNQIGKIVNATTTFNFFNNKVNGDNVSAELQSSNTNWTLRSNISFRLTPATSFQVSGMYMSPAKQPQGSFKGMSGVDAGFRQDFLKGKLTLSVNVSDIFNTRKFVIYNVGEGFELDSWRKRETRVANFTLSYRFGSTDNNLFQKKKQNRQPEMQPDMNPDF